MKAHERMGEYFGGTTEIWVPDNLKSGVVWADRYEPGINRTYEEQAAHYGAVVIPARVRKPRDKAKVESGILVVQRWILAVLRHRTFFSIGELNEAIREPLESLNRRPMKKLGASRRELPDTLRRSLSTTNAVENLMGSIRRVSRNVKRWKNPEVIRRWTALGVVTAQKRFRQVKGYREMSALRRALRDIPRSVDTATVVA